MCHMFKQMGVIYGDSGIGKTEAVREYVNVRPDVILIEADPGYSPTVLFAELQEKLGYRDRHNVHQMLTTCIDRLKNSGRLIIIDEAEQLPYKSLEMIRRLHDKAQIGILLVGMEKLRYNLCGPSGQYAQLYNRIFITIKLDPITEADFENIIKRVIGDTKGLWRIFYRECKANTRRLFKMIQLSEHIAKRNTCPLDAEVVMEAAEYLLLEKTR